MIRILAWPYQRNLNSYNKNLYQEFESEVVEFSWSSPFVKANVFHIHWPETYLGSNRLIKYVFGSVAVILLFAYYRLRGIHIVWSVHNTRPHISKFYFLNKSFYKCLSYLVNHYLVMNEFQMKFFPEDRVTLLRHGMHFRSVVKNTMKRERTYCLMFGAIARYKDHLEVFDYWKKSQLGIPLKVVGWCNDIEYLKEIKEFIGDSPLITIDVGFISDHDLDDLIDGSCAVLVNYGHNNSGVIYRAVERGTRVLVKDSQFSREMESQFPQLINTFDNVDCIKEQDINVESENETPYSKDYDWKIVSKRCEEILIDVVNTN